MINLLRKTMMLGMGTLSFTKERAEKIAEELVQKGEATADEAKAFLNEIVEKGEKERQAIGEFVRSEFANLKSEIGWISVDEYNQLQARIEELEKKLAEKDNEQQ